jgi:hypothetical protein
MKPQIAQPAGGENPLTAWRVVELILIQVAILAVLL